MAQWMRAVLAHFHLSTLDWILVPVQVQDLGASAGPWPVAGCSSGGVQGEFNRLVQAG